jgi:hypothetical protein
MAFISIGVFLAWHFTISSPTRQFAMQASMALIHYCGLSGPVDADLKPGRKMKVIRGFKRRNQNRYFTYVLVIWLRVYRLL